MSIMGEWVDMSLEDFKKKLIDEKTPVGVISSLIVVFESTYWDLNKKRAYFMDCVLNVKNPHYKDKDYEDAIRGLFFEMLKIEGKIIALKERKQYLMEKANKVV